MGLKPVELDGRDRAEVEPVDVHGVQQRPAKLRLVRDGRADQRRADAVEHLLFGALHHGHEGEHIFFLRNRGIGCLAVNDRGQQIVAAFFLDQPALIPVFGAVIRHTRGLEVRVDRGGDGTGHAGNREGRKSGVRVIGRQRLDRSQTFRQGVGDFAAVPADPDSRAADAAPAAVDENAVEHQAEVLFPLVHAVVAEQDLGETRPVRLHPRVAPIALDRRAAAKDQTARAAVENGGADVAFTRVYRYCFARNAGLKKGFCHPVGRPGLLRPGFQHEPDLQRNDRQPERVNAGRI